MTYNRFIFNASDKKVIRDFEGAYKNYENVYPGQFDVESIKFRLLTSILAEKSDPRVLDIGAGYGAYVRYLQDRNISITGVEISESAICQGKEMFGEDLALELGDLSKGLRFIDNEFDIIACYGVITWLMDQIDSCLLEMKRVLKSGGLLALSTSYKDSNIFFRDVINNEQDLLNIIAKHFTIEDFFIHYHEIGTGKEQQQNFNLQEQTRDLVIFCRKEVD